jgi:FlaA1/EpsC-like NDP-sugar epimerase
MTTILVIGATGTVGSEVVKQLVSSSSSSDNNKDTIIRAAIHSQGKADNFKEYNKTVQLPTIQNYVVDEKDKSTFNAK